MIATRTWWLALVATVTVAALGACDRTPDRGAVPVGEPTPVAQSPAASAAAQAQADELPPDGRQLFDFMLATIPDLVAKVPCSCCPFTLAQCYHGACPTSCGPCNKIGRKVYKWHEQGVSDDEIVSRVVTQHPRKSGR